jgi:hypothetical protein
MNWTNIAQGNINFSDHDANSPALANSGGNGVVGVVATNAANPTTATSAAVNLSPVTQSNTALDLDVLNDMDGIDIG